MTSHTTIKSSWKKRTCSTLPTCDFCTLNPGIYDAPTKDGPWANMCSPHLIEHGSQLAAQLGTKRILRKPTAQHTGEALEGILANDTEDIFFEGVMEVSCPACSEIRPIEPDASGSYECDGCHATIAIPCSLLY